VIPTSVEIPFYYYKGMCILTIKRLAFITILLTYGLIVFGGYVASSESGMGCGPEWPLCNGEVLPTLKGDTLIEFTHRVIGAFLVLTSVLLLAKIIQKKLPPKIRVVGYWMMGLLVVQVLFGAIVVILDLPAIIVSTHLIIAMIYLASLIWIWRTVDETKRHRTPDSRNLLLHLNLILVLLLLTLAFGAYTKHELYGLGCGWLDCGPTFLPTVENGPGIIQSLHRMFAFLSAIYLFVLTCWSFIKKWPSELQWRLTLASSTVLVQLVIGVITIMTSLDLSWAVLHLAVGTLLFSLITETRVVMRRQARSESKQRKILVGKTSNETEM
jgi:heme a synthase